MCQLHHCYLHLLMIWKPVYYFLNSLLWILIFSPTILHPVKQNHPSIPWHRNGHGSNFILGLWELCCPHLPWAGLDKGWAAETSKKTPGESCFFGSWFLEDLKNHCMNMLIKPAMKWTKMTDSTGEKSTSTAQKYDSSGSSPKKEEAKIQIQGVLPKHCNM